MARYIDADLFKKNTNPVWFCATNGYCGLYDKKDIEDMIDIQPTVDVQEVKHGHWVRGYEEQKNEYGETHIPHCKCSECNNEFDTVTSLSMKFCSNCGTKMDGGENDV